MMKIKNIHERPILVQGKILQPTEVRYVEKDKEILNLIKHKFITEAK